MQARCKIDSLLLASTYDDAYGTERGWTPPNVALENLSLRRIPVAAGTAGYERAVTVSFRRIDRHASPFALPRIPIRHDTPDLLAAKVAGRLDRLGRLKDGRTLEADVGHAA